MKIPVSEFPHSISVRFVNQNFLNTPKQEISNISFVCKTLLNQEIREFPLLIFISLDVKKLNF